MIYLDHHAATPHAEAALSAMREAEAVAWANPSSVHRAGQHARRILEQARARVAGAVNAKAADVVLTSGGTEAVNLAVRGLHASIRRAVRTGIGHPALVEAVAALGVPTDELAVPGGAPPDDEEVAALLGPETLFAVSWVNHETGTLLPVARWAALCRERNARFVVDASQALGKVPVDLAALDADAVAFASPKIGGPAGAGAVVLRRGIELDSVLRGGGQERGRRPGSPDVIAAAGFGGACTALEARLAAEPEIRRRRDRLEAHLVALGAVVNGAEGERVATVSNVSVQGQRGQEMVAALDVEGVCAASGAACSSGVSEESPVLRAMYPDAPWRARAALRLSLGPETRDDEVAAAMDALTLVLGRTST